MAAIRDALNKNHFAESTPIEKQDDGRYYLGEEIGALTIGMLRDV